MLKNAQQMRMRSVASAAPAQSLGPSQNPNSSASIRRQLLAVGTVAATGVAAVTAAEVVCAVKTMYGAFEVELLGGEVVRIAAGDGVAVVCVGSAESLTVRFQEKRLRLGGGVDALRGVIASARRMSAMRAAGVLR